MYFGLSVVVQNGNHPHLLEIKLDTVRNPYGLLVLEILCKVPVLVSTTTSLFLYCSPDIINGTSGVIGALKYHTCSLAGVLSACIIKLQSRLAFLIADLKLITYEI